MKEVRTLLENSIPKNYTDLHNTKSNIWWYIKGICDVKRYSKKRRKAAFGMLNDWFEDNKKSLRRCQL